MRKSLIGSFAAGAVVAAMVLSAISALADTPGGNSRPDAAIDGKAPSLRVEPVSFVIGSQIDAAVPYDPQQCDFHAWHTEVPMRLAWEGADGRKAVDSYDLWAIPSFMPEFQVLSDTDLTEFDVLGGNYDSSCGGPSTDTSYRVEASDSTGNSAHAHGDTNTYIGVWQEDGSTVPSLAPGTVTTTRTSMWAVSNCACSDAGQTLYSTTAGARATFTVTPDRAGQWFAIVMPTGPSRGAVSISMDGEPPTTVDTFADADRHRVVVWQAQLSRTTHTVVVTNAGTAGRSRVDLDAVLIS